MVLNVLKKLSYWVRNLIFLILVSICKILSQLSRKTDKGIIIIKLEKIGDFVLFVAYQLDLVSYYRQKGLKVSIVVSKPNDELIDNSLYESLYIFNLDDIRNNVLRIFKWLRIFIRFKFETVIVFTHSPSIFHFGLSYLISSRTKIISSPDQLNSKVANFVVRILFDEIEVNQTNELSKNKIFVESILGKQLEFKLANFDYIRQDKLNLIDKKFIAISPTAGWLKRAWSKSNFISLINSITGETDYAVILFGTKAEQLYCEQIKLECGGTVHNFAGKLSIKDYVKYLRSATAFIGNESGGSHLAFALGIDVFCILGGGHFGRFFPYDQDFLSKKENRLFLFTHHMDCYGCNWNCIYNNSKLPCIDRIYVERVKPIILSNLK
jgi:ADP-heptose:LPS heptosyltransferase